MARVGEILKALGVIPSQSTSTNIIKAMVGVYLTDWKCALDLGRQLSNITWRNSMGVPFSDIVMIEISQSYPQNGPFGRCMYEPLDGFEREEKEIIESIKSKIDKRTSDDLIKLASSTYPMIINGNGVGLDLVRLAQIYKRDFLSRREKATA
ncbi:hypothetical protein [Azospirillum sp. TSA6c]|uniref:hypothetical protein n=1 Tax=Azospirillum sp. TSA6c TaxID=709813 RepID=UPI0011B7A7C3|nr:hypothetical protein [Azospirillum sp. TSA6c]